MSFDLHETSVMPPFFGKDRWTVDPRKIVTRQPINTVPTIPEEEDEYSAPICEEEDENTVQTTVITVEKHVRFAPYIIQHTRINGQDYSYKMEPLHVTRARSEKIEMLEDENLILRLENERLTKTLVRKNKRIANLETENIILTGIPLLVLLVAYVLICEYVSSN